MKQLVKKALRPAVDRLRRLIKDSVTQTLKQIPAPDPDVYSQQIQRGICNQYALFRSRGVVPYPNIGDAGFRVYSQSEEDGN